MADITLISYSVVTPGEHWNFIFQNDLEEEGQIDVKIKEETTLDDGNEYYLLSITGFNTLGTAISVEIYMPKTSEPINPTKVFLYIAKKLKEVLCPKCI